jgi:glucosamine kinase
MDPEPQPSRWIDMASESALYIGVDGGGSRCRARIEDAQGRPLGEGGSGPATTRLGVDKAWRSIMRACEAAAEQAGVSPKDFAQLHAGIGIAGLGRRGAEQALNDLAHPFRSVRFISDGLAACLGAHGGADGAIVVAGTGSIGVGLIGGRELRYGGYGFPISDEGSGADIGLQAIRLALRASDGRGDCSPLLDEVLAAFDHDPYQAVAWSEQASATDFAAFAPIVLRHANQGDPIGRRIFERAADAVGDLLDMFLREGIERLSLVGGLSGAIIPWLTPDLRDRLKAPDADAAAGAALAARRHIRVNESRALRRSSARFGIPNPERG